MYVQGRIDTVRVRTKVVVVGHLYLWREGQKQKSTPVKLNE